MWHTMTKEEIKRKLRTDFDHGLSSVEADIRHKQYGENKFENKKKTNLFIKFLLQFNDFMIIILLLAAIISAIMAYTTGSSDYLDSVIIIGIVVFNAILGLIQENRAEKAIDALAKLSSPYAKVKRDGKITDIPCVQVVPGDIVLLETGNFVPADCRIISSNKLEIEESALTGEAVPVCKDSEKEINRNAMPGDMLNMAFATTTIVKRTRRRCCM